MREVLDARVEIKSGELLKNQEISLLTDLEKIKIDGLESEQKTSSVSFKAAIQLER